MGRGQPALSSATWASGWSTTRSAAINVTWALPPPPARGEGWGEGREVSQAAVVAPALEQAAQPGGGRAIKRPALDALGAQPEGTRRAPDASRRGRGGGGRRGRAARLALVRARARGHLCRHFRSASPHRRPGGGGGRTQRPRGRARRGWGGGPPPPPRPTLGADSHPPP